MEKDLLETPGTLKRVKERFNKNYFEEQAWQANQVICGLDEVGRGCLAGPLVTAAVILPPGKTSRLLKDSKLMTAEERLIAFKWIEKHCWYSLGIVHHRMVDEHNVWHATLICMKKALVHLMATAPYKPAQIITDCMPLNLADTTYKAIPVHYFPHGERKSSTIAAASIVAKVKRDAMMQRMDTVFPGYLLASHKGYSTPPHKRIIREGGTHLIIHRKTYLNRMDMILEDDSKEQGTILQEEDPSIRNLMISTQDERTDPFVVPFDGLRMNSTPVRVDGALRLAQDELRECLPAVLRDAAFAAPQDDRKDAFTPERKTRDLAKAGETSPLGSYGASIEANGGKGIVFVEI
jgi:ribonuclease HII